MVLGIGVDLCRIERIRRSVTRFGKDWLDEVFTEGEQAVLGFGDEQARQAAIGFALKEACAKAIGTGFARGVRPQDFVVTGDDDQYSVLLTGAGKLIADQLCPDAALPFLHACCRTSESWVNAFAVLAVEGRCADANLDLLAIFNVHKSRCLTSL